jgi:hypothetical protein
MSTAVIDFLRSNQSIMTRIMTSMLLKRRLAVVNRSGTVNPVIADPLRACRLPFRFPCSCVHDNIVRKIRAQKLSGYEYCHTANSHCPGTFGKIGELVTVPGNEIIRSIELEQFCGLCFLFRGARVIDRRNVMEQEPWDPSLPTNGSPRSGHIDFCSLEQ